MIRRFIRYTLADMIMYVEGGYWSEDSERNYIAMNWIGTLDAFGASF